MIVIKLYLHEGEGCHTADVTMCAVSIPDNLFTQTCLSYCHSPFSPLTELGSPFRPQQGNILFLIHHMHRFPDSYILKTNNKYICSYHFHTVTVIEAFGQHNRNLAMSLHKQLHFAVFYKCVLLILC